MKTIGGSRRAYVLARIVALGVVGGLILRLTADLLHVGLNEAVLFFVGGVVLGALVYAVAEEDHA